MLLEELLNELEKTIDVFPLYVSENVLNLEVADDFKGNSVLDVLDESAKIMCNVDGIKRIITFDFKKSIITDSYKGEFCSGEIIYNWNGELERIIN